ncbi:MAG: DUF3667 domain-containing protein [Flavobacteriales bacterium]|mgnify:CR=1 FL=1|nr:DUF3667 domain-containing protein [Flavobacteriales bacterium]MCB0809899.1 DUF3667 domain-containing protein [Flavobacteriales bacterium]MCB0816460.1 DUF3667 domain-containing protein [Flavobacteriales bacterium]MCB9181167.1 DUF3667 domain-containing protein [Flavobacteriales bacterium]MCB9199454.1 DUF3667 domain-containing protein [Flavobacteriales bacterium]
MEQGLQRPERTHCLNCDGPLNGPYCPDCGQKRDLPDFTWHFLLQELPASLFQVDRGIWYTIRQLFTRPGHAIRDYLAGKRVRYFRPISLLVLSAGLYGFLGLFLDMELPGLKMDDAQMKVIEVINRHYALVELVLLPFIAFGTWLFFRRSGYNFVEHLVLNAFLGAQRVIVTLALLPAMFAMNGSPLLFGIATAGNVISMGLFVWALVQLFQERSAVSVLFRSLGAFALSYFLLGVAVVLGVVALIIAQNEFGLF